LDKIFHYMRVGTAIAITGRMKLNEIEGGTGMEMTFMLPNGVQAGVRTVLPSNSSALRFGKDVPVLFHVSDAEAFKRVLCRFGELTREQREGIC
jgi:hypothetical protein